MSRPDLPDHAAEIRRALTDPRALCEALGLEIGRERMRSGVKVLCPWHGEKRASCSVTLGPDGTIRAHCFGCNAGGDALSLIAAALGLDTRRDFRAVLEEGGRLAGISVDRTPSGKVAPRPAPARPRAAPRTPPQVSDEAFAALLAPLLALGQLDGSTASRDVAAYLARRGLLDLARAEGWAALPPVASQAAWIRMLLDTDPTASAFTPEDVRRSGLLTETGATFLIPEARLILPWRDPEGRIYSVQRRRLDDGRPKYATTAGRAARWPYGVELLSRSPAEEPIAIVEGAIDALALRELCRRRGSPVLPLGLMGTSGWTSAWAELGRGRLAFVALDNDPAGNAAVEAITADLRAAGAAEVKRMRPRGEKDWAGMLAEDAKA